MEDYNSKKFVNKLPESLAILCDEIKISKEHKYYESLSE
jgi:hypothetical protein